MSLQLLWSLATMMHTLCNRNRMKRFFQNFDPRRSLTAAIGWLVIALAVCFATVVSIWVGGMARTSILQQHVQQFALETDALASDMNQALRSRLNNPDCCSHSAN